MKYNDSSNKGPRFKRSKTTPRLKGGFSSIMFNIRGQEFVPTASARNNASVFK